jgi:hypothetical protein
MTASCWQFVTGPAVTDAKPMPTPEIGTARAAAKVSAQAADRERPARAARPCRESGKVWLNIAIKGRRSGAGMRFATVLLRERVRGNELLVAGPATPLTTYAEQENVQIF